VTVCWQSSLFLETNEPERLETQAELRSELAKLQPVEVPINTLRPGARFRFHNPPYYTQQGTVLRISACSVRVELDGDVRTKQFTTRHGKTVTFQDSGRQITYWAPETPVEAL
jgi:hypothetical protein